MLLIYTDSCRLTEGPRVLQGCDVGLGVVLLCTSSVLHLQIHAAESPRGCGGGKEDEHRCGTKEMMQPLSDLPTSHLFCCADVGVCGCIIRS